MVLQSSLPWFPAKASALIAAFLQTARTSALSPSPKNLSPVYRYTQRTDIIYKTSHTALHTRDVKTMMCWPEGLAACLCLFPLTSLMYFISSWRWLTVHSRAITSCCLSEPTLCTMPYTLGPWCCSEVSGAPLVMSLRCWGRQDPTGQVSVHRLHWGWLILSLCLCVCVFVRLLACTHPHLLVRHVYGCKCLHIYTWSGISSTSAAEHWKQEAGNRCLKKVQGVLKVSCFCNPVHELLPFLSIVPLQTGGQWKEVHASREVQHLKQYNK